MALRKGERNRYYLLAFKQLDEFFGGQRDVPVAAVDHADRADPFFFRQLDHHQLAVSLFVSYRGQRHDRYTEPYLDTAFDRLDIIEFGNFFSSTLFALSILSVAFRVGVSRSKCTKSSPPRSFALIWAFFANLWSGRQISTSRSLGIERSSGPAAVPESENAKLDLAVEHVAQDLCGPRVFEVDPGGREFRHEFAYFGRELVKADAVNRSYLHGAADLSRPGREGFPDNWSYEASTFSTRGKIPRRQWLGALHAGRERAPAGAA